MSCLCFIVSGLTFRSLIHFEFIFVNGVRQYSSFILLKVVDQFSQQEYWSGEPFPSPGDLPDPRIKLMTSALQADSLPLSCLGSHDGILLSHKK